MKLLLTFLALLLSQVGVAAAADGSDVCHPLERWEFRQNTSGEVKPVRAGYSLTDPIQAIASPEGRYETSLTEQQLTSFQSPTVFIPAVGGLVGVSIDGAKIIFPFADYASIGPIFKIPRSARLSDARINIEILGDHSSYAGFWNGVPLLCEYEEASHRQAMDELYQRRIPNFLSILCLGLMTLFAAIYRYTSKRFQVYRLFSYSMAIWTIYFSVLSGLVRTFSYEIGTAAIFPARVLGGLGMILLFYSYRDKPLRKIDKYSIAASAALIVPAAVAGAKGNFAWQIVTLLFVVPFQIPVVLELVKQLRESRRSTGIAGIAMITFWGLVLDLTKLVGPKFGIFTGLPYLERITLPPTLLCSAAYFIWHFTEFYSKSRVTDFRHRILSHLALRLAGGELTEEALIRLSRAARRVHLARRTSIAKLHGDGTYRICGVSGFNPSALGSKILHEKHLHIKKAIDSGCIAFAKVKNGDDSRYRGSFGLAVPIPLRPNPEYLLLVSDNARGHEFQESDIAPCRQFYAGLSSALLARQEREKREIRERDFRGLVEQLDPNLYEFIQRNVAKNPLTVDDTCERGIIFFDQKSYTTLLESLHPDRAALALQNIKKWVATCALRQNARIKGFYGDAFIVEVYPLPLETIEHTAVRTAEVAWDLCEGVDELNRTLVNLEFPTISFRFGACFGLAANVDIDMVESGATALIGDAVNLSQRIQTQAPPGSVLVADSVAKHCQGRFIFQPLDRKYVKGRSNIVSLFRVAGRVADNQENAA